MTRSVLLSLAFIHLAGCYIVFPEHGSGDDVCDNPLPGDGREPASAIAPLRNPNTLTCDDFNGGGCNPDCGPCPLALAPIPSWGQCFSSCEGLGEAECSTREDCRIVKDAFCAIQGDCFTDFVGCFPTDTFVDTSLDCTTAFDGESCSRNPACTAFHRPKACPLTDPVEPECLQEFAFCAPEGVGPGLCNAPVACDAIGPDCPPNATPGIADGCFTGVCIPFDLCEIAPNQ
jgi:hypothetical protein